MNTSGNTDWREAAQEAETQGALAEAQRLYEQLFDYPKAAAMAQRRGRPIQALRLLLKHGDPVAIEALRGALLAQLDDRLEQVVEELSGHGYAFAAAETAAAMGQWVRAARLYEQAHSRLDAARIRERLGEYRAAGELYERHAVDAPESAQAWLGLGRTLQRFDEHQRASDALQRALHLASSGDLGAEARARWALSLARLGLERAASMVARTRDLGAFLAAARHYYGLDNAAFTQRFRVSKAFEGPWQEAYLAQDLLRHEEVIIEVLRGAEKERKSYVNTLRRMSQPPIGGAMALIDVDEALAYVVHEAPRGELILHQGQSLTGTQRAAVAKQLVRCVEQAHQRGVIHGALSPWCVFLRTGLSVVVGGFEARFDDGEEETSTGLELGAMAYWSPERVVGRETDYRSDFYGVGALLHFLFAGSAPHAGAEGPLGALVAVNPAERPQSHRELHEILARVPWDEAALFAAEPEGEPSAADEERYRRLRTEGSGEVFWDPQVEREVVIMELRPKDSQQRQRVLAVAGQLSALLPRVLSVDEDWTQVVLEHKSQWPLADALQRWSQEQRLGYYLRVLRVSRELEAQGVGFGISPHALVLQGERPLIWIGDWLLSGSPQAGLEWAEEIAAVFLSEAERRWLFGHAMQQVDEVIEIVAAWEQGVVERWEG